MRLTEVAQVCIPRDDDSSSFRRCFARAGRNDFPNQATISFCIGLGLVRLKACVMEKLPGGARDDEAAMGVVRLRFTRAAGPFALVVEAIFPDQFIRVGESVVLEVKPTDICSCRRLWSRTPDQRTA